MVVLLLLLQLVVAWVMVVAEGPVSRCTHSCHCSKEVQHPPLQSLLQLLLLLGTVLSCRQAAAAAQGLRRSSPSRCRLPAAVRPSAMLQQL